MYEDSEVLVIDKPAGMVVNRAQSVRGETVQDWVERYLKLAGPAAGSSRPTSDDFGGRSGVVHRLDKETSGAIIIAKTLGAFVELQRQFGDREVEKKYIALVHGKVVPEEGIINAPVGRLPWHRERFGVLAGGREAVTNYKVLRYLESSTSGNQDVKSSASRSSHFSLLELYPQTGRTHQIRVHLKSINHPIVADTFYAGRKTARNDRKWCPRLFLHASEISLIHPESGDKVGVVSELPNDLKLVLEKLV